MNEKIRGLFQKDAVIDNNILNDFAELGRMDILNKVFNIIQIPESIINDEANLYTKSMMGNLQYELTSIQTEEIYNFFSMLLVERPGLSDYDAELIAIARQNFVLCSSNEKRIMNTCEEYEIEYTGTLGILCCAYEYNEININELHDLMEKLFSDQCTCHLSPKLKIPIYRQYGL